MKRLARVTVTIEQQGGEQFGELQQQTGELIEVETAPVIPAVSADFEVAVEPGTAGRMVSEALAESIGALDAR